VNWKEVDNHTFTFIGHARLDFGQAIFWLDMAATVGDTSSLHAQARIHMKKAGVFEDLLKNADIQRFPAKFETRSVLKNGTSLVKAVFSEKHVALPHESFVRL
jgi:hypothetical protein